MAISASVMGVPILLGSFSGSRIHGPRRVSVAVAASSLGVLCVEHWREMMRRRWVAIVMDVVGLCDGCGR